MEHFVDERESKGSPWRWFILLLLFAGFAIVGTKTWWDKAERKAVSPQHQAFLDELAKNSMRSKAYLASYAEKFKRSNVASVHFEQVCAAMIQLADADGLKAEAYSRPIAEECRRLSNTSYRSTKLPES